MFLKRMSTFLTATLLAVAACAQQPAVKPQVLQQPDTTITYASAADVAALVDRAKKERKDDAAIVTGKILQLAPYAAYFQYRADNKQPADAGIHPKYAELIYVLDGSATFVTGGKLAADRMSIAGGDSQKIAKGDFIFIPEGTPHWISHIDQALVIMTINVPRPVPAP